MRFIIDIDDKSLAGLGDPLWGLTRAVAEFLEAGASGHAMYPRWPDENLRAGPVAYSHVRLGMTVEVDSL
jgi:hypothetical protein